MNKEESKFKVEINYGKSFLKVSPKTMVDYFNGFKLHQSSPSGSAFNFAGVKRVLLQVPQIHLNRQEIAKIIEIVDNVFTGSLKIPNLLTGIGSHTSNHPRAYYISASKSWDPDAPLRLMNLYAREFDKWMKTWRNFLAAPSPIHRSQFCFFLLLHLFLLLLPLLRCT